MKTTKGNKMTNWIEWKGGECPVDGDSDVAVFLEDGGTITGKADLFFWGEGGNPITRYRVVGAKEETEPTNKYRTPIGDVYDVLKAFEVTNPALQHLIKKALKVGKRGHKDIETDLQDIIDSAVRAKELEGF